jgi:hypothetical protein
LVGLDHHRRDLDFRDIRGRERSRCDPLFAGIEHRSLPDLIRQSIKQDALCLMDPRVKPAGDGRV